MTTEIRPCLRCGSQPSAYRKTVGNERTDFLECKKCRRIIATTSGAPLDALVALWNTLNDPEFSGEGKEK